MQTKEKKDKISVYGKIWRQKNKKKRSENQKRYYRRHKEQIIARKKKFPQKHRARHLLYLAVSRGKIKRGVCVVCRKKNAEAHHEDYSKPLDIVWLCKEHHTDYHAGRITLLKAFDIPIQVS